MAFDFDFVVLQLEVFSSLTGTNTNQRYVYDYKTKVFSCPQNDARVDKNLIERFLSDREAVARFLNEEEDAFFPELDSRQTLTVSYKGRKKTVNFVFYYGNTIEKILGKYVSI